MATYQPSNIKLVTHVDAENPTLGDLLLENGTVRLTVSLREDVEQELMVRFKFFLGEWFLDTTQGTPWFQSILGIKVPLGVVAQILRAVLLSPPGVASITQFDLTASRADRTARLRFAVKLIDGKVLTSADFTPFVVGAIEVGGV